MGILLVTAYTGKVTIGDSQCYSHGYSKYSRQPRVRTVLLASMPPSSSCPAGGRIFRQHLAARSSGSSRGSPTE